MPSTTEVERKFLLPRVPRDLASRNPETIRQGYIAVHPDGTEVRVRDESRRRFTLTAKGVGDLARAEVSIAITRDEFDRLWRLTAGRRLEKTRFRIPTGKLAIEVDVYGGHLRGLQIAEVEFPTDEEAGAFEPPEWFGHEVTGDRRYKNQALASLVMLSELGPQA
jgi:CYTH domain-containing protein